METIAGLFADILKIKNGETFVFDATKTTYRTADGDEAYWFKLRVAGRYDVGYVKVSIDVAKRLVTASGPGMTCNGQETAVDMVTHWAAGFVTDKDAKAAILALNPHYVAPASVKCSAGDIDALLNHGRATSPFVPALVCA
ncbi:MAG: hypothetical protein V4621_03635 [Pseudomonadota bacterium]